MGNIKLYTTLTMPRFVRAAEEREDGRHMGGNDVNDDGNRLNMSCRKKPEGGSGSGLSKEMR